MSGPQRFAFDEDEDDESILSTTSVSHTTPPRSTPPLLPSDDLVIPELDVSPITQLTQTWQTQLVSPTLLPYPYTTLDNLLSQMEQQQSILDSLTSSSEEEHLRLNMVALDLERARWVVRSFLRQRLNILETHSAFYVKRGREGMSESEWAFVQQFERLRYQHFKVTVLDGLPNQMRGLDDEEESSAGNMVTQPDLDSPVFVRCKHDCGPLRLPDGATAQLERNSIHLLRYRSVQHLILSGRVQPV